MAVQDRSVASANLTRVVEDNDLGIEGLGTLWRVVLGITADVATADFLDRDVLDVEPDVVTRLALDKLFVVHFDRLDFGGHTGGSKGNDHAGLDDAGLDTADRYGADTTDLVHVLERKAEGLVGRTAGRVDGVDGLEESLAGDLGLGLLLPALVPRTVGGRVNHVVAVEAGDGDEGNVLGVVADLLDEVGRFLDDFVETVLGPLGRVHLVDGANELPDTEGVGEQGVFASLAILRDAGLELTSTSGNDENGAVSLRRAGDHVLDEVAMARSVDDGDVVPRRLELPEGNVDGDTTLTLGLELVEHPSILEGALAKFGSFLEAVVSIWDTP